MPEKPVPITKAVAPGPNMSIWSSVPLLHNRQGRNYHGRAFVEVWDKDEVLVLGIDPSIQARAHAALRGQGKSLRVTSTPWTDEPATGRMLGQTFLGRAVIEVWDDQVVVAITGSDPRVLERAIHILSRSW